MKGIGRSGHEAIALWRFRSPGARRGDCFDPRPISSRDADQRPRQCGQAWGSNNLACCGTRRLGRRTIRLLSGPLHQPGQGAGWAHRHILIDRLRCAREGAIAEPRTRILRTSEGGHNMNRRFQRRHLAVALAALFFVSASGTAGEQSFLSGMLPFANPTGVAATFATAGKVDLTGPFFQSLGTNGRACVSCHQASTGWTITPANVQARFDATDGTDPIFRTNDGSNSPAADVSTLEARRAAYSMLLSKGLIRVGIGIPQNAEFALMSVDDPYGHASASELSLFRRPLPSTNLKFLSTIMWDGRETFKDPVSQDCILGTANCFASLHFNLVDQSNSATMGHAQAAQPLTTDQREAIVTFEMGLFTAQVFDDEAGELTARQALGGPQYLSQQNFYFGVNDVVSGDYRTGALFNPTVFKLYEAWNTLDRGGDASRNEARRAVARGETLFNSKLILITGVKGLNDDLGIPELKGTCTTCHDTPSSGNYSI